MIVTALLVKSEMRLRELNLSFWKLKMLCVFGSEDFHN